MGFYLRKSFRAGPVRFNLSKSGIGTSVGVKGFRVGAKAGGGTYVHAGRNGFYYRAPLSSKRSLGPTEGPTSPPIQSSPVLTEIDSGPVAEMVDSSATALLQELNEKHQKWRLWPWVLAATVLALLPLGWAGFGVGLLLTGIVAQWDKTRRATTIHYSLDSEAEYQHRSMLAAFNELAASKGLWHLSDSINGQDAKRNAGATSLVKRQRVQLTKVPPSTIQTNVEVPTVPAGKQMLCFLPDRLLVFDPKGVGAVSYDELQVRIEVSGFIESEAVPSDAKVIGETWRYVNKKGGPDKRFSNNRRLPICAYETVGFTSASGLNELLQVSRQGTGEAFRQVLAQLTAPRGQA